MGMTPADLAAQAQAGPALSEALARSMHAADAVLPVLRHLLASEGPSLLNEAVVARTRGMLRHLAEQLYLGRPGPAPAKPAALTAIEAIMVQLTEHAPLLAHIHNLALEGQLAERFEQRLSLDPVLSPLLQELIASDDPQVAELAMSTLAAQTRFMQAQRRMELPLAELPAELLSEAVACTQGLSQPGSAPMLARLQEDYDEAETRLGRLARLVRAMRGAVVACLAFDRAGLALFASGLGLVTGIARVRAILAVHEQQGLPLAVALRAAGLDLAAIDRQMVLLGAASPLGGALSGLGVQQARQVLATSLTNVAKPI